jgi:glycosyltransferase involved in cell wall biosynthesis
MSYTEDELSDISPDALSALVITYNEEANIYRTLNSIRWLPYVLVIDSGSTDKTIDIVSQFRNTRVVYRKFDSFANQCNFGLSCLSSEWVLSLDADYSLSRGLSREIYNLLSDHNNQYNKLASGYSIRFKYCINGRPIRSGLLPPRTCLYKRISAYYLDVGHGHRVILHGTQSRLKHRILHDDRKSAGVWIANQKRYLEVEALCLYEQKSSDLSLQDLIRKHTCLAPLAIFLYCYVFCGGFLDGKAGIIYAFQRLIAECLLYLNIHMKNDFKSR